MDLSTTSNFTQPSCASVILKILNLDFESPVPVPISNFNCDFSILNDYDVNFSINNCSQSGALGAFSAAADENTFSNPKNFQTLSIIRRLSAFFGSVLILINIGTKTSFKECKSNFKRPIGVIVGFLCQFTVMPLLALSLIYTFKDSFNLTKYQCLGIFCCGCSPGGTLSNFVVGCVKGDINLSVAMTITSQIASIVMIPVWLYVYEGFSVFMMNDPVTKLQVESGLAVGANEVPIFMVVQALFSCLFSLWIGYTLVRKYEVFMLRIRGGLGDFWHKNFFQKKSKMSFSKIFPKISLPPPAIGLTLTGLAMSLVFLTEKSVLQQGSKLFLNVAPLTLLMPISGIVLGYIFGYLAYRMVYNEVFGNSRGITLGSPVLRTIGIETGIQNIVIPSLIFNLRLGFFDDKISFKKLLVSKILDQKIILSPDFTCPAVLVELIAVTICFVLTQYLTLSLIVLVGKIILKKVPEKPLLSLSDSELKSEETEKVVPVVE